MPFPEDFEVACLIPAAILRPSSKCSQCNLDIVAGSKIKVSSMIHMSWELAAIELGYAITRIWTVQSEDYLQKSNR